MTDEITTELPDDYPAMVQVGSLIELFDVADNVGDEVNVIVWRRGEISGEFNGLAHTLSAHYGQDSDGANPNEMLTNDRICINDRIRSAFEWLWEDLHSFKPYINKNSSVRWISDQGYVDDTEGDFHPDGPEWRLMCCYNNPTTEWIKNEDALHKFEMEYIARSNAVIRKFAQGDVWLHAGYNRKVGEPFIHRGPNANEHGRRLLFAS